MYGYLLTPWIFFSVLWWRWYTGYPIEEEEEEEPDRPKKRSKLNPTGEDCHLEADGSVTSDEDKIIRAQRIFRHEYYKPYGKWYQRRVQAHGDCVSRD
jgi:hypothetical protein